MLSFGQKSTVPDKYTSSDGLNLLNCGVQKPLGVTVVERLPVVGDFDEGITDGLWVGDGEQPVSSNRLNISWMLVLFAVI